MYLVGFLLLAAPVVFVALLALAIDVTARKSRERKAVDAVAQTRLTDGNSGDVGELSCENQRQGSNVVRVCVILGFVLTGSMFYMPLLVWLVNLVVPSGNPPAVEMNLAFLSALIFIAPFGLLAFLCALFAKLCEKGKEKGQGR